MSDKDLPAFPSKKRVMRAGYATEDFEPVGGMYLRDYFALNLAQDEIRELTYKTLSREAQEQLAGMKYPQEPAMTSDGGLPSSYYIEVLAFNVAVNAAIRFMAADAMLEARKA